MPHCSSPFLRIGAIHSIPDASREVYFGTRHQRLNRMTLQQSPASSHDLARICYFWTSSRVRRTASAGVHGPGSVFLLHVYCETASASLVEALRSHGSDPWP